MPSYLRQKHSWLWRLLAGPFLILALSAGVVAMGAMASLWSSEIRRSFPFSLGENPEFAGLVFWCTLIGWTVIFYIHKRAVAYKNGETSRRLERLVIRAPHRNIFKENGQCVELAWEGLRELRSCAPTDRIQVANQYITRTLRKLAWLAKSFGGTDGVYSTNIMLALTPQEFQDQPQLHDKLMFFNLKVERIRQLGWILCMERNLIASIDKHSRERPCICLPVPKKSEDSQGRWLALPGAPMTFLKGIPGIHENLEQFVDDCEMYGDFKPSCIEQMRAYFHQSAPFLKSFASFKLGDYAVLNIDCSKNYLLGEEEEFIANFNALIFPTLILLAELLEPIYNFHRGQGGEHGQKNEDTQRAGKKPD